MKLIILILITLLSYNLSQADIIEAINMQTSGDFLYNAVHCSYDGENIYLLGSAEQVILATPYTVGSNRKAILNDDENATSMIVIEDNGQLLGVKLRKLKSNTSLDLHYDYACTFSDKLTVRELKSYRTKW